MLINLVRGFVALLIFLGLSLLVVYLSGYSKVVKSTVDIPTKVEEENRVTPIITHEQEVNSKQEEITKEIERMAKERAENNKKLIPLPALIENNKRLRARAIMVPEYKYEAYRETVTSDIIIPNGFYSFVYLDRPNTTESRTKHYTAICNMYMSIFYNKDITKKYLDISTQKLLPVYWFTFTSKEPSDCETMVKDYNYLRAKAIVKSLKKTYLSPCLIAVFGDSIVTMDLANLIKDEDLDIAFTTWKEYIVIQPKEDKDLDIVNMVISAKKVLESLKTILSITKI